MTYIDVGPTGWVTAYHRSLADIEYSKEILSELVPLLRLADQKQKEYFEKAKTPRNAIFTEVRFKLINKILYEQKANQIFEIASGLSSRGLSMTQADPNLRYVELDLPNMINVKRKILKQLTSKLNLNIPNLRLESGDALNYQSLYKAVAKYLDKNISVVNEGLLRYLNFDQKKQVSQNIHGLLEHFGGVWITSDITLREHIEKDDKGAEHKRVADLAEMDLYENVFRNVDHAKEFFTEQGFKIEQYRYTTIENELVSPKKIKMSKEEVHNLLQKSAGVFVMTVA